MNAIDKIVGKYVNCIMFWKSRKLYSIRLHRSEVRGIEVLHIRVSN